uniref:Uncharacterized protein n=1 Tax=Vespula pensylvanica TaxID=30213 RepID=A0A834U7Q6_VESPE|nr:hypothetical protein H0235_010515 [Vespula pensylvanica]
MDNSRFKVTQWKRRKKERNREGGGREIQRDSVEKEEDSNEKGRSPGSSFELYELSLERGESAGLRKRKSRNLQCD